MPEVVRIAITDNAVSLTWPPRCPRCGVDSGLTTSTNRVGRVSSIRPNLMGGFTMRSDVMVVSVPMCERHAGANTVANLILQRSPLMAGLRGLAWVGLALLASMLVAAVRERGFGHIADMGAFLLFPAIGIVGGLAMLWARKNSSVWPKSFDPDVDVLEVQFADERYARHFKRANRDATDSLLTAAPPWYMRKLLWQVAAIGLLILWFVHLAKR
jgi:hypothetical protein